jgi:hypothetical protein
MLTWVVKAAGFGRIDEPRTFELPFTSRVEWLGLDGAVWACV